LVRALWADTAFMARFNRQAAALPADDAALRTLLAGERDALVEEHQALHWTVQVAGHGVGFVSLVNVGFRHRRAEFLIGLRPGTSSWAAVEAAHLALGFAAGPMQLERLVAHFYPDNVEAIRAALKLGFEHEGVLRGHLRDAATGRREDLVVTGLLLDQAFAARTARLRRRLFGS
jgi:RimJ/RimL family protein N-acetyltransferase